MKILMLSSYLPHPLFSGGHIRLYNLLHELSKKHAIVLICEKRPNQSQENIKEVEKFCKEVITVERKKQWTLRNIGKTGFSLFPFLMVGHTNSVMKQKIEEVLEKEQFDLIHVETFYVMQNLPAITVPTVLVEHNIEYLVYRRFLKRAIFLLSPFILIDVLKLKFWEEYYWEKASKLVAVSEAEKRLMKRDDVAVVPNGVNTSLYKPAASSQQPAARKILFIGDFQWLQNRDAAAFILKEIWPAFVKTSAGKPKTKLWIVGREIPDSIKNLTNDPDVIFDENAPEKTEEIYEKADILLAPIRVGGGTSYKILEAMASGVPVVTTELGVEGLEVTAGEHVLIGTDADKLALLVNELISDDKLYKKIAKNARKRIEEKYDWKIIVKKLELVYQSVVHD